MHLKMRANRIKKRNVKSYYFLVHHFDGFRGGGMALFGAFFTCVDTLLNTW